MKVDECIFGVLNYEQLEHFCKRFNLKPSDLKANFDGWRKLVLFTEEKVFLFPRDPRGVEWLDREVTVYELMNKYTNLPVPRFIESVKDTNISYYEFAVVSRLKGKAYSKFEGEVTFNDVRKMLLNLVKVITSWHEIPLKEIPATIKQKTSLNEEIYHWENKALEPSTTLEAFDYVYRRIIEYTEKYHKQLLEILSSEKTQSLWINSLKEIVSLPHVLLHADIHEDQILVESKETMKITGILDWETVRMGNPVWDFNFFEWGFGIWDWWKHFSDFRREMWRIYLEKRKIRLKSLEGLDLFYTLSEFLIVLQPEKSLVRLIGKTLENSVKICLEKLVGITKRLEEK